MGIENLFRYTALAVGLKPSAMQGKARLHGLYRIISSKTIRCAAPPDAPCAVGLKPSAMHGEARQRGLERIISQRPIGCAAPPVCAPAVGLMEIEK